ncbi:MAG: DUF1080 domain-containing protein [Gemmataceae bacterium]|nr:DUF1080 domain-containing protein [Gemmata sp.]MDW8197443.1 DUF1080 domain-containing protein [Gemmataceae bacterium]
MRKVLWLAVVAALPTAWAADDGFTPLFDGKSFNGWDFYVQDGKSSKRTDGQQTWSIKDGIIYCTGKPNGYMVTQKEFGDYILKLKWRFPADSKGGNSGVLLHVQDDKFWPTSVEAQLFAGRAGDFWLIYPPEVKLEVDPKRQDPKQPRHYFRIETKEPVEKKFGEWNQYEITCKGGDITLVVNGLLVNEGKNGSLKKGRIALQAEGAEIHFKDIEIKSLK